MLFNSLAFMVFLPIVAVLYYLLPHAARWLWLLAASYFFYAWWRADFTALLLFSTALGWLGSLGLERYRVSPFPWGRWILAGILAFNIGALVFYKYLAFFNESLRALMSIAGIEYNVPSIHWTLPLGISFFTFRIMSYCMDVSRGTIQAERHFGRFALYVAFFPQLLSGPIERAGALLPQFRERIGFEYGNITEGLKRIAWGMFKKAVIADRLAMAVSQVYGNPQDSHGIHLMLATVFYAVQLFCDFSAYSDMAVGVGRIFGFRLTENFNHPYAATSLSDYWRRWHISLSTWFNDYLYTPLAIKSRNWGLWSVVLALMATFLCSGLWHGAAWTFVAWGVLHGMGLSIEVLTKKWRKKIAKKTNPTFYAFSGWCFTFGFVCFSFILFRANSFGDALYIAGHLFKGLGADIGALLRGDHFALRELMMGTGILKKDLIIALISISIMEGVHWLSRRGVGSAWLAMRPFAGRWALYHALALVILYFGVFGTKQFIYFKF